jgi:hypothetical protein
MNSEPEEIHNEASQISPDYVRISMAAAIELGLIWDASLCISSGSEFMFTVFYSFCSYAMSVITLTAMIFNSSLLHIRH